MSAASGTGQFWLCPQCRKHVPARSTACRCGFSRAGLVGVAVQTAGPEGSPGSASARPLQVMKRLFWVAAVALLGYFGVKNWLMPGPFEIQKGRVFRPWDNRPETVYVPVPAVTPGLPIPTPSSASVGQRDAHATWTDGATTFDREMAILSGKADLADVAWGRYREACRVELVNSSAAAALAGRDWFAYAFPGETSSPTAEACAEATTFHALAGQIKEGICVAEDRGREASMSLAARRELRAKYRLDWEGWDRICR
jgi:hypothetical protein